MIWIIGEYAGRIENADELLTSFLETFHDETAVVQLQLLTATVKLFLKKPHGNDALVRGYIAIFLVALFCGRFAAVMHAMSIRMRLVSCLLTCRCE